MSTIVEEYNLVDNFYGLFNFTTTQKDGKLDSENFLNITIVKRTSNGDIVVGKKAFSWPDSSKAETIAYDNDNGILRIDSSSYIAEVSLKLPKNNISIGKKEKEPVKIFKGFGKEVVGNSNTPVIVKKLCKILNGKENINWDELNNDSKEFLNSSILLIEPFNTEEQDRLINLILENRQKVSLLLKVTLHGKFLSMRNFSILLEKLIDKKDWKTLELLIVENSSPIIDDKVFGKLVKYCTEITTTDEGFEFFKKLLSKGFGSNMLASELEKQLSVQDAIKLLEWLICMPVHENQDDSFGNLVEFCSLLLDSHFHKFVWDDSCHDLLRRFYLWTQSWITLAESFTSFSESAEIMKALSTQMEDLLNYNSGYTISKVILSCTPLC